MEPEPIITVTPTVMDGTVVRWYRDLKDYEVAEPVLSASRNRWMTHGGKTAPQMPAEWLRVARETHTILREDWEADVSHLATHRAPRGRRGMLVPIQREGNEGD